MSGAESAARAGAPTRRVGIGSPSSRSLALLVVGTVAAWLVGVAGPWACVRGYGQVTVYAPVQSVGLHRLLLITFGWLVVGAVVARRWGPAALAAQVGAYASAVPAAASNIGRSPAVVAVTGCFVAFGALVRWQPWPGRKERTQPFAVLPVVPLAVGADLYARSGRAVPTLVCFGVALALVEAEGHRLRPLVAAEEAIVRLARQGAVVAVHWWGRAWSVADPAVRRGARATLEGARRWRRRVTIEELRGWRRRRVTIEEVRRWRRRATASRPAVAVGAAVTAIYVPLLWRLCNRYPAALYLGINDLPLHIETAARVRFYPFRLEAPHFVFHLTTALWRGLVGRSFSPVMTLTVSIAFTYVALRGLLTLPPLDQRRLRARWASWVAGVYLCMETPSALLQYTHVIASSNRYLDLQTLYSPTWITALPFTLATLVVVDELRRMADDAVDLRRRRLRQLALLAFFGAAAKPAFALCFLPVLPIFLLFVARLHWRRVARICAAATVPALVVIAWQTWYLSTDQSKLWEDHFRFDPIGGPVFGWHAVGFIYLLGLAFLPLAIWASRGRYFREPMVQLIGMATVVAALIFTMFQEYGVRAGNGNLGVPLQVCVTVLTMLAVRTIAFEAAALAPAVRARTIRPPVWSAIVVLLVPVCVASFAIAYADTMGWAHIPIHWSHLY